MPEITVTEYRDAARNDEGWCIECKEFTREMCEPDAENYDCPVCEGRTVMGAELAMVRMDFDITEDKDETDQG